MSDTSTENPGRRATDDHSRIFLVVVDKSEEMERAVRFAALRAKNTDGRVALFHSIESADFQHWMGVGEIMRAERRQEAEELVGQITESVVDLSTKIPIVYLREGDPREELMTLIDEEPGISILVLAAGTGKDGPGPLITYLMGKGADQLHVPLTIVPGNLSIEKLDALT
jgi:nucleotide-binding universal stress UspA family protein